MLKFGPNSEHLMDQKYRLHGLSDPSDFVVSLADFCKIFVLDKEIKIGRQDIYFYVLPIFNYNLMLEKMQ